MNDKNKPTEASLRRMTKEQLVQLAVDAQGFRESVIAATKGVLTDSNRPCIEDWLTEAGLEVAEVLGDERATYDIAVRVSVPLYDREGGINSAWHVGESIVELLRGPTARDLLGEYLCTTFNADNFSVFKRSVLEVAEA